MGARQGRSVESALALITEAVHTVWRISKKAVTSLILLDVAGAFDNVTYEALLYSLRLKEVPLKIV